MCNTTSPMLITKYARVKTFKNKKYKTVFNAFMEILNKSNDKSNNLSVDQGKELYNTFMQKCLGNNDILMYSTHSEGASVIIRSFMKTLKAKIYKKMTANNSESCLFQ